MKFMNKIQLKTLCQNITIMLRCENYNKTIKQADDVNVM